MTLDFMVATDDIRSIWTLPNIRLRPRGPRWFSHLAERFIRRALRWARAEQEMKSTTRHFSAAMGDTLLARMRLSARDLERIYYKQARYAFVGPEVLDIVLADASAYARMMSLGVQEFRIGYGDKIVISGIEIIIVPWMTGALLVPDWKE